MVNPNKTLYTKGYTAGQVPVNPAELPIYLQNELQKIQAAMEILKMNVMDPTLEVPARPRLAMPVYALGAPNWDPGSGEGFYYYNSAGAWVFLG